MLKTCLNCGLQFDGAPQARFHSNACRVAYSRKLAQGDGEPEQDVRVPDPEQPELAQVNAGRVEEVIARGRASGNLTAEEEQLIRDHFGYASSEQRTLAERDRAASRISGKERSLPGEEAYVAECMKLPPLVTVDGYEAARKRQQAYARWRYRAVRNGEVASL